MTKKLCPSCDKEMLGNFCAACGAKLIDAETAEPAEIDDLVERTAQRVVQLLDSRIPAPQPQPQPNPTIPADEVKNGKRKIFGKK